MAKSRGRKFAELLAPTNGVFAASSLPTISLSKLANSTFSVNSESASLGGNVVLDSNDITEHTSAKYFTNARAQATLSVASNSGHGALAYDNSNGQFTFAGITTEAVQDVVGAQLATNGSHTGVSISYDDAGDGAIDLTVNDTTKVPLAGGTMTGNLTLGDNVNAYFGASTDLRIYHDGTNSHIINSTGELRFTGSNLAFKSDSAKLLLGASDDLQIYHDGSNSYIKDYGTGRLHILSATDFLIANTANTQNYLYAVESGAVRLYYSGSAKFETTSTGVAITGLATMATGTASSKFAVGTASVHGSYDFYNNGTTYLNGAVTVDDALTVSTGASTRSGSFVGNGIEVKHPTGASDLFIGSQTGNDVKLSVAGANALRLYTNSVERLNISGSGAISFNNAFTFPASDGSANQILQTNGSGTVSWVTNTGGSSLWTASGSDIYYSSGNVGIGYSSPAAKLDIRTANIASSSNFATKAIIVRMPLVGGYNNVITSGLGFYDSTIHSTDIGYAYNRNSTGGYDLVFSTNPTTSGSPVERMTINADGLVGIGTAAPGHPLSLQNSANKTMLINRTANNEPANLNEFSSYYSLGIVNRNSGSYLNFGGGSAGTKIQATDGAGSATAKYITLNPYGGNVGIGIAAPAAPLHVNSATDQHIILSGATNPYIRWQEASTNKAYMQWNAAGYIEIRNQEDGSSFRIKDALDFSLDGSTYHTVWHAGNDGTGSGLDADLLDGLQGDFYFKSATNNNGGWSQSNRNFSVRTGGNAVGLHMEESDGTFALQLYGEGSNYGFLDAEWGSWDLKKAINGELYVDAGSGLQKVWHQGNDGAGSGLDADTLDGVQAANFVRTDAGSTVGNVNITFSGTPTSSNIIRFDNASGQSMNSATSYLSRLECRQGTAGADAFMSFHVGGDYAAYFGLDGATNDFAVGGWSMGANKYKVWHEGNDGASSGLYAQYTSSILGTGGINVGVGSHEVKYSGQISNGTTGLFNAANNANGILRLNTHGGNYYHDLGFSSDGSMYHRYFNNSNAFTTTAWNKVWTASNDGSSSGLDADLLDGSQGNTYMKGGAGAAVTGWWIDAATNGNSGSPRVYFSHSSGYGQHINTYNTDGSIYALEIHNNTTELFKVMNDGQVRIPGQLRIGAGANDGYFYSDSAGRTAFAGGDFYIQNSVSNYYNYATNQYLGDSSGDNIYFRGNTISGTGWSLTGAGVLDLNGGHGALNITSSSILSSGSSTWTGNPGSDLKIQAHSNRWYIVANSSSAMICQFRQDGSDKSYIDNAGRLLNQADARAPIFYDENDTAYYADIAGTSRFNYIKPSDISLQGNGDQGTPRWDFRAYVVETPHHYGQTATQTMYLGEDNTINIRDHAICEDDCRAPIFYHSSDTTYYVRPGSSSKFNGDIFIDGNYGAGIVGVYASTRYQHVWSMGAAYRTSANGTSYGNMYGITYTHTNVGTGTNESISGLSHQWQHRTNGTLTAAIGAGIWTSGNVTAYSDIAVKTNLQVIPNALEKVCSLHGYTYERTDYVKDPLDANAPDKLIQAGVVAQEVEKVLPEVVSGDEGNKNVAYGNMVSILIEAIKELKTEVDELKAQLNKEK